MANINPIDVEKTLKGIDFPADKEAIINKAKENGAGDNEISALTDIPDHTYNNAAEVAESLAGNGAHEQAGDEEKNIEIMDEEPDAS